MDRFSAKKEVEIHKIETKLEVVPEEKVREKPNDILKDAEKL